MPIIKEIIKLPKMFGGIGVLGAVIAAIVAMLILSLVYVLQTAILGFLNLSLVQALFALAVFVAGVSMHKGRETFVGTMLLFLTMLVVVGFIELVYPAFTLTFDYALTIPGFALAAASLYMGWALTNKYIISTKQ